MFHDDWGGGVDGGGWRRYRRLRGGGGGEGLDGGKGKPAEERVRVERSGVFN